MKHALHIPFPQPFPRKGGWAKRLYQRLQQRAFAPAPLVREGWEGGSSAAVLLVLFFSFILVGCEAAIPQTNLSTAKQKADQCVAPTEDMRRNHMVYLDGHRDKTVIEGIRTKKHSLNECVNCHVSRTKENGEALHYSDPEHFCASCHAYVGVKIDCFQCHADRPEVMETADYKHKLSADEYHAMLGKSKTPSLNDLLLLGTGEGVVQ